jgi:hypothetical protein
METIPVSLGSIKMHPSFKRSELAEHLITTEFLLEKPHQMFGPLTIAYLLELHPIQVVLGKNDTYYCVGGLRTLSIVRRVKLGTEEIPVKLIPGINGDAVLDRCLVDILVSTTCFSVRSGGSIIRTLQLVQGNLRKEYLAPLCGPSKIARMFQVSVETVRKWGKLIKYTRLPEK